MLSKALAEKRDWIVVGALVALSIALRAWLAHVHFGFLLGDDVETAQAAYRRAFGLAHTPWDVRSLLIPELLMAPLLRAAHALGVRDPLALLAVARAPFIVLSSINVALLFVLGRRWYSARTGVFAAALYAFHWIGFAYGSTFFPRTVAVTAILSAAILVSKWPTTPAALGAGGLAALAATARYSEAIYVLPLILLLPRERRGRLASAIAGGFALGLTLFIGLYDRISWGVWFGSLLRFAELTFIRRDASSLAVHQPPAWYLAHLLHWIPATAVILLIVAAARGEAKRVIATVIVPVAILSGIFHKELRYVQVVVPFAMLLAVRGWDILRQMPGRSRLAAVLLVAAFPLAAGRTGAITGRSTNAAEAALWMRAAGPDAVALSQSWAYGGRLLLGDGPEIVELEVPPVLHYVRAAAPDVGMMAVYTSEITIGIEENAAAAGLTARRLFDQRGGRSVTVFHRPTFQAEKLEQSR